MKLGAAITLWGRPRLSEIVLRNNMEHFDRVVAVRSPEDPQPARKVEGVEYVEHPNSPLSEKWAAGISALRDCDAVMILGSDDLVNEAFVQAVRDMLEDGYDYIQPKSIWFYDTETMRCSYAEAFRIGGGRTFSKAMLDKIDWNPWPRNAGIGALDRTMDEKLDAITLPRRMPDQLRNREVIVGVKTGDNRWSFDDMSGLVRAVHHPVKFWRHHFPDIADDILNL